MRKLFMANTPRGYASLLTAFLQSAHAGRDDVGDGDGDGDDDGVSGVAYK